MSDERVLLGYPVGRRISANSLIRNGRRKGKNNMHGACFNKDLDSTFQGFISSTTCQFVFAVLDPLLLGVVQVKFQNSYSSPFQTRPASLWAFVLSVVVYVFTLAAATNMKGKNKSQLFGKLALLAGSFSSVSLVSVLLPSFAAGVIFIIWAFLPIMVALDLIKRACFWIHGRIKDIIYKILGIKDDSMEEQPQLSQV